MEVYRITFNEQDSLEFIVIFNQKCSITVDQLISSVQFEVYTKRAISAQVP